MASDGMSNTSSQYTSKKVPVSHYIGADSNLNVTTKLNSDPMSSTHMKFASTNPHTFGSQTQPHTPIDSGFNSLNFSDTRRDERETVQK